MWLWNSPRKSGIRWTLLRGPHRDVMLRTTATCPMWQTPSCNFLKNADSVFSFKNTNYFYWGILNENKIVTLLYKSISLKSYAVDYHHQSHGLNIFIIPQKFLVPLYSESLSSHTSSQMPTNHWSILFNTFSLFWILYKWIIWGIFCLTSMI